MTETLGPSGGDRQTNERLDRFDENMLAIQEGLLSVIKTTEANSQAINSLAVQVDRNALAIDRLASRFDTFVAQAETERQTFQTEIRRIWEYLLSQSPNGRGGTE